MHANGWLEELCGGLARTTLSVYPGTTDDQPSRGLGVHPRGTWGRYLCRGRGVAVDKLDLGLSLR
jgi:hypothetical protein